MQKRITALLLVICLILSAAPVYAGAATAQQVVAGTATVTAGNSVSVTVRAEDFSGIATLEVYIYYDANALTLSSTSNGSLLSGSQASVNTSGAGTVKLVAMSLNGITGSGNLLTLYFNTSSDCAPGTYPVQIAIGNAYDASLEPAQIGSTNGSVTVNEPVVTETFSIYGSSNKSTLRKGDTLSFGVYSNYSSRQFVSADFTLTYDHEILAFDAASLASNLTKSGALYSINSSVLGQVRITYASNNPITASHLFTVDFTVIADEDTRTTLKASASNVCREDLSLYMPGECSYSFTLKKLPEVIDYPDAFLRTELLKVGQQSQSTFLLEQGAGVAAADFTLSYDPSVLSCISVTAADEVSALGGMVVINENFTEGTIRFSYINMDAYDKTEVPIVKITWQPLVSPDTHYQVSLNGVGVVDAQQSALTLEYVTDSGCIYAYTTIEPDCDDSGGTGWICTCRNAIWDEELPAWGHTLTYHEAQSATCTQIGWDAYESCSVCNYSTYSDIPALGHDLVYFTEKAPDCTQVGWYDYESCTRCSYSTYREIAALGHRKSLSDGYVTMQNSTTYPFTQSAQGYSSTNHMQSSSSVFTITAVTACSIQILYGVSSEANCDKLIIRYNNSTRANISGEYSDQLLALDLKTGDRVTITYQKDGSVDRGQDAGWFNLLLRADTMEATCTQPVTCDYCQAIVKEALPHSYDNEGICQTCGQRQVLVALYHGNVMAGEYASLEAALADYEPASSYIKLLADASIDLALDSDLYIDLNGFSIQGKLTDNGYSIFGMDSTTDAYSCESIGYFDCVDESGDPVVPQIHFKSSVTGTIKRYLAISSDVGYSFHRFYLGISKVSLKPAVTGLGFKAVFCADEMVIAQLDQKNAYGFGLLVNHIKTDSLYYDQSSFASGKTVGLSVENIDVDRYAELPITAKAILQLSDGTCIESTGYTTSLRGLVEQINENASVLDATQINSAVQMIDTIPSMRLWEVGNIWNPNVTVLDPNGTSADFALLQNALQAMTPDSRLVLCADINQPFRLDKDLYLDLNGHTLSGVIVTNGYQVYGMDSTTDSFTCEEMGYFTCVDENGEAILPVSNVKIITDGSIKRYVAICTESGYTFHRYYMGVTHMSLKPDSQGVGYKAVFAGDPMVLAAVDSFGYSLQLGRFSPYTVNRDGAELVSRKTVSLRIDHFDVENYGETVLTAQVFLSINGEKFYSTAYTTTLMEVVQAVDQNITAYPDGLIAKLTAWLSSFEITKRWNLINI